MVNDDNSKTGDSENPISKVAELMVGREMLAEGLQGSSLGNKERKRWEQEIHDIDRRIDNLNEQSPGAKREGRSIFLTSRGRRL